MQPRISGGYEPDEKDRQELSSLYRLSATALSGTYPDRRARVQWAVSQFVKAHAGEPNYAHKWAWVWSVDNLGLIFERR